MASDRIPFSSNPDIFHWEGREELNPILRFANCYTAPPGEGFGPRYVQEFQLLFVCHGLGTLAIAGETHEIGEGDLVYYGPGERHQVTANPEVSLGLVGIVFLFRRQDELCLDEDLPHAAETPFAYPRGVPACPLSPTPPTLLRAKVANANSRQANSQLRQRCESLATLYSDWQLQRPLEAHGLLWLLMQSWQDCLQQRTQSSSLTPRQIKMAARARQSIDENLADPPTLEAMAGDLGISAIALNHIFALASGKSWRETIEDLRLRAAYRLLQEGRLNVNEAGRAVGFEDPFYFSRRFKRQFGMAPSQLRREGVV